MEPIRTIKSKTVVLNVDNIDTDQIIPARFLKVTTKEGLGKALFTDWRYEPDGSPKADFALNKPEAKGCTVLVAGDNFGCGSSREHAPWALTDYGLRAIVSTSFADIFRNNALKNGLVPVIVGAQMHKKLVAQPGIEVVVDLDARTIALPDGSKSEFPIDAFARYCLMEGIDSLEFLMRQEKDIAAFEKQRA